MINRRNFLTLAAAPALFPLPVRAQAAEKASAFVKSTGDRLVAVVNGPGSSSAKRAQMSQIINSDVDVNGIGRFCLGRYWRQATPEQQKQYLALFHEVLVTNITAKLGEYQGVTFTMGRSRPQDDEAVVSTTVIRPNNGPTAVDWIISNPSSDPKIVDVVAEGTSLRLTQRQDYASYLAHNNGSVDALIAAMKSQISQNG
ncbi:MAG TPA: ABC transporter substrate-binding protein [Rhodopila sp.]|jgi:phospholipid transport system substrate-binding protein